MKKYIIITLITFAFISIVIVDTMAGPSKSTLPNRYDNQSLSTDMKIAISSADETDGTDLMGSRGENPTAMLSMLLIGLTLVGMASFREGREGQRNDRSE